MRVAPDKEVTIYALKREGEAAPYYIGQAVNAARRRKQHGVKPEEFIELEKVPAAQAHATEREWVRRALALGIALKNDHYNPSAHPTSSRPIRAVVTFGAKRSGTFYCWLNIKQGTETIEGYTNQWRITPGDPISTWQAVAEMAAWLRDLGYPQLAHRPIEWAQQKAKAGSFPPSPD